jgi:mannosyltransferase
LTNSTKQTFNPIWASLGIALILIGVFLPRGWYDTLRIDRGSVDSRRIDPDALLASQPVKGVTLLQFCFIVEGITLVVLSRRRLSFRPIPPGDRSIPGISDVPENSSDISASAAWKGVIAITALGAVLRIFGMNSGLWLDEISPVQDYASLPVWKVVLSYVSSNNHLLYTLLMKLSIAVFGLQNWAIRLPAVLFGIATVPALYFVARLAMSRMASLGASLLLAVSYHHIFFTQNARGYSGYLFFSLLASALLYKALKEDRFKWWACYALTMFLDFSIQLISAWVFAAHVIVCSIVLFLVWRRSGFPARLFARLTAVFAVTGFLIFHLYASVIPQALAIMAFTYGGGSAAGFSSPLSPEFLREMLRGVSAGFGAGILFGVLPFFALLTVGFLGLLKRNWPLTLALTLPAVLFGSFLLVRGLAVSPRFFILGLPLAMIAVTKGFEIIAERFRPRRQLAWNFGLAAVFTVVSLAALVTYYRVPKQDYGGALSYIKEKRQADEVVIAIYLAERGIRFYGPQYDLKDGANLFYVRSMESLDRVLAEHPSDKVYMVTTFSRALRMEHPELIARMQQGWQEGREFRGTVGDGNIKVWVPRSSLP